MPILNVVFRHREVDGPLDDLAAYERAGGYAALKKALADMEPDEVLYAFHRSGLRGRGGAGFPTGRKARFLPQEAPQPAYGGCKSGESGRRAVHGAAVAARGPV